MGIPAIIDCDPGHDDVMAILLGARTLDLKGITTVHGNASLPLTTKNARYLVELAGITEIPIAAGMGQPILRHAEFAPEIHGKSGLDGPEIHEPTIPLRPEHAVDFIYDVAKQYEDFHLLPVGPLSNVGAALRATRTCRTRSAALA